jgi:hypothetical protein
MKFEGTVVGGMHNANFNCFVMVTVTSPHQQILVVNDKGEPQKYDWITRKAALWMVLDREPTDDEVIQYTRVPPIDGVVTDRQP